MESCYIPNNPQFGISVEYTAFNGGYSGCGHLTACDTGQLCCEDLQSACPRESEVDCGCQGLSDLSEGLDCSAILDGECAAVSELGSAGVVSADAGATWEDMGSFSLPALDLEPLPSLFPFSPCSGNYKGGGDCRERGAGAGEAADVLLSLKHAAVHDCSGDPQHPQVLVSPPSGGYPYYEQYAPPPLFPTMSVNVSMNMTMHGYPPEQMCPQVQWSQSSTPPAYAQSQAVLSPTYPSATYSFTADFRTPPDPLAGYKPLSGKQQPPNYALFQKQQSFGNHPQKGATPGVCGLRRPSGGAGYAPPSLTPEYVYPGCLGGKVQVGALSGCSEEDDQKPNLCRICGKTYARPSTLKTHLRTHSGERPYRCGDCDKSFSQAANLTAHVRTHTGQKPFRCPICDRRFSQSSSVTTHMRTHSGERPYRCRACKKAFSDSSTLTKHLRIHSGEKPYQCKLCLLRFSQSGNLNRHMRVHGNNAALLG